MKETSNNNGQKINSDDTNRQKILDLWSDTITINMPADISIKPKSQYEGSFNELKLKKKTLIKSGERVEPPPDYELIEIVGQGGLGVIYKASQSAIERTVAVKKLHTPAEKDKTAKMQFLAEALITGELDHPNIIPIHDLGTDQDGILFYSMKFIKGTLWNEEGRKKKLNENLEILLRVSDAVAFAHSHNVIHRDIKPANVILGEYGEVMLIDWGLALRTNSEGRAIIRKGSELGGTPTYMAPEMALLDYNKIGVCSDIYLLGGLLYWILTGKPPHEEKEGVEQCLFYAAKNELSIEKEYLIEELRFYETETGELIYPELIDIVFKSLSTEPGDRYGNVKEFQEAVKGYLAHSESLILTTRAERHLDEAQRDGEYSKYGKALFGFEEAIALWEDNSFAKLCLEEAYYDYARTAYKKGDYDLALSLLSSEKPDHTELIQKVKKAKTEIEKRVKRLKIFKGFAAVLIILIAAVISISYILLNLAYKDTIKNKNEAVAAWKQAGKEKENALKNLNTAEKNLSRVFYEKGKNAYFVKSYNKSLVYLGRSLELYQYKDAKTIYYLSYNRIVPLKYYSDKTGFIKNTDFVLSDRMIMACMEFNYPSENKINIYSAFYNNEKERIIYTVKNNFSIKSPVLLINNSTALVYAENNNDIVLYDIKKKKKKSSLKGHKSTVNNLVFEKKNNILASSDVKNNIIIWNLTSMKMEYSFNVKGDTITQIAFQSDGRFLSIGGRNSVRIHDIENKHNILNIRTAKTAAIFISNTDIITYSDNFHDIILRDISKNKVTGILKNNLKTYTMTYHKEKNILAAAGDNWINLWDINKKELLKNIVVKEKIMNLCFREDGKYLAANGEKKVYVWDIQNIKRIKNKLERFPVKTSGIKNKKFNVKIKPLIISPSGKYAVSSSDSNGLKLWDISKNTGTVILQKSILPFNTLSFSSDEKYFAAGGMKIIKVWDSNSAKPYVTLKGHTSWIKRIEFSPDNRFLASVSKDKTVILWNLETGSIKHKFEEYAASYIPVACFSHDANILATGWYQDIFLWDIKKEKMFRIENAHKNQAVKRLEFSSDGTKLISGSEEILEWETGIFFMDRTKLLGMAEKLSGLSFKELNILEP